MKKRNWPVTVSVCLAFGGIGTVIIVCFLIGFGLHTPVGKDALYVAFALEVLSLLVVFRSVRKNRSSRYCPSAKMRGFLRICAALWLLGALLLVGSLLPVLLGVRPSHPWVRYPCLFGTILAPLGWLGLLMAAHRQREASLVLSETQNPVGSDI